MVGSSRSRCNDPRRSRRLAVCLVGLRLIGNGACDCHGATPRRRPRNFAHLRQCNRRSFVEPYFPRRSEVHILVTSNAPAWRGLARWIETWPSAIGRRISRRSHRPGKRTATLAISNSLGGLPLAHEQAAAHCERLGISLADCQTRWEASPQAVLDSSVTLQELRRAEMLPASLRPLLRRLSMILVGAIGRLREEASAKIKGDRR